MNYLYEAINPTRLYIKQCPHCGLKYFGKTSRKDIHKYSGSGVRWSSHLDKHGAEPIHLWNSDWYYDTSVSKFALRFSRLNKIVSSKTWANLKEENGLDGGWNHINSDKTIREKQQKTLFENYAVHYPLQSTEIQNTMSDTVMKRYGVEHYSQTIEYKEKYTITSLTRYGVDHPLQSTVIRDKGKKTNLEKYGFDHPMKSEIVRNKGIQTNLEKYGVKNYSETQECKDKIRKNNIEKYGVESHSQLPEERKRISERAKKLENERRKRPQVKLLRKYIELYGSKNVGCGRAWFRKSDVYLDDLLDIVISKYGHL